MCGIAGILSNRESRSALAATAGAMARCMIHRGPDSEGVWTGPNGTVALGFRRLSILDLSSAGDQPMLSADRRYVIVFNGEIYNFDSLRRQLESRGHSFRGRSDTEVILAAVLEWGVENAFKNLHGMFACGLWDTVQHALWLFRDRLGIKPLYYGLMGTSFAFASELKAFRVIPTFKRDLDAAALAQYFLTGYIPAPLSIYKGVFKLEPGHFLRFDPTSRTSTTAAYWRLADVVQRMDVRDRRAPDLTTAANTLDEMLQSAVARHMVADVPVGVFLSGGVDSSLVAALAQKCASKPVRTFAIGFESEAYNEAPFARAVADHIGTEHHEYFVPPSEVIAAVPQLPEMYDEPFADSSQIPTFLVSRQARRAVTVALSGDGGDELFGGYMRYLHGERAWRAFSLCPQSIRGLARSLAAKLGGAYPRQFDVMIAKLLGRDAASAGADRVAKVRWLLGATSLDQAYDRLSMLGPDSLGVLTDANYVPRMPSQRAVPDCLKSPLGRMSYFDLLTYLPDDILTKLDRASMAVSLEARVPLLDDELVEFAVGLPSRFKIRSHSTKFLLRQVLYRYVPSRLIERPKAGFALPLGNWLRGPLRDWCESLLSNPNPLLDQKRVHELWQAHVDGRARHHATLWAVLMLNGWLTHQKSSAACATACI